MGGYAWVTLATNDAYSLGALVLAHSLRRVGTKHELTVLVTPGVTQTMREKLAAVFSLVQEVNVLDSKDEANLALLARPELGITFTKLHCWRLTQYEKCVFVDADTLVVRNCDELFEREELSAAPDVGWPDCFNSGVFVYRPSQETFASITAFAAAKGSFDGGDQGLLNMYFNDWSRKDISKHLPFIYNMCSTATYSYLPAFKQFGEDVRIIHFIGITKPWLQYFDTLTGIVQPPVGSAHLQPLLQLWWNIFCEKVHPQLSPVMATSTLAPIWHEFIPSSIMTFTPKSPTYSNTNYETHTDVYLESPDFSEFKDPWENYCIQNDPLLNNNMSNTPNKRDKNYYCSVNEGFSSEILNNNYGKHTLSLELHHNQCYDNKHHNQCHSSYLQPQEVYEQEYTFFNNYNNKHPESAYSRPKDNYGQEYNKHSLSHSQGEYHEQQHLEDQHFKSHEDQSQHEPFQHYEHQNYNETFHKQETPCFHTYEQQGYNEVPYKYEPQRQEQQNCNQHNNQYNSHHSNQHENQDSHYIHNFDQCKHETQYEVQSSLYKHKDSLESNRQYHEYYNNECHSHEKKEENQHHNHSTSQESDQRWVQNTSCFEHHNYTTEDQVQYEYNRVSNNENYSSNDHVDIIVHYNHNEKNNSTTHGHSQIKESSSQQNNFNNGINEQTDTQKFESHPSSTPCTDLHNIATHSDLNVTEHLDSSNAGLAGALAQMTLGVPRSAEQIALEEHMRKQSWEQGQIDYMGRDSFDNIWKKICETLALTPQRQASPPKDEPQIEKSSTNVAAPLVANEPDNTTAKAAIDMTEEQFLTCKISMKESLTQETHAKEEKCILPDTRDKSDEIIAPAKTIQEEVSDSRENENLIDILQDIPSVTSKETSTEVATEKPVVKTAFEISLTEFKDKVPQDSYLQTSLETQTSAQRITEQSPIQILDEQTTSQQVSMFPSSCLTSEKSLLQVVSDTTSDVQDTHSKEAIQEKESTECPLQTSEKQGEDQTITPVKEGNVSTKSNSSLKGTENIDTSTLSQHIDETIAKAVSDLNVMENIIKSSSIKDEQHAEMLSAAAEILTTSPVPIQVAESVLQTEPKESISGELKTITEGVISSTVTPVHESSAVSIETAIKDKTEINGEPSDEQKDVDKISSGNIQAISDVPLLKESEIMQPFQSRTESKENISDVKSSVSETLSAETGITELKESVQVEGTEVAIIGAEKLSSMASDILTPSLSSQTESPKLEKISILESTDIQKALESTQGDSPIRPTRTKELNIPPTPTVTEATPPTSPPIDPAQDVESSGKSAKKAQKKTIKKTASESDTAEGVESEGTEKKLKKVVKKPGKKSKDSQDEGAESCSATDKPKKTGKVTKKVTKPTQTLGADTSVPDTPPPGSSDAPVPPKRKVKSSTAAKPAAAKKPDTEE